MANYPGENENVPKRLVEALETQPLSFLVPKDGLASLFTLKLSTSLTLQDENLPNTLNENIIKNKNITLTEESITKLYNNSKSEVIDDEEDSHLYFKRPKFIEVRDDTTLDQNDTSTLDLYENLSPLAKKCLKIVNPSSQSTDIVPIKSNTNQEDDSVNNKKRKIGEISNNNLDLANKSDVKATKVMTGLSMNEATIGKQYIKEFEILLDSLNNDNKSINYNDADYWLKIANNEYVPTEKTLQKIQLVLNNILKIPRIQKDLKLSDLLFLMDNMINNISTCRKYMHSNSNSDSLNSIAYLSVYIIFSIFLLERDAKRLSLEQYVFEPINFLSESLESIKLSYNTVRNMKNHLTMLLNSVQLFPLYVHQNPYIDDGLVTKLTYLFIDIFMDSEVEFINNPSIQHCWDNIKKVSSDIIIMLFQKIPLQRKFIVDELLASIDKLPNRRIQKKLQRISELGNVTFFTPTILSMLENINCFDTILEISNCNDESYHIFNERQQEYSQAVLDIIEHINDSIYNQFLENTTKYRHVMDNYIQDLLVLLPSPAWPLVPSLLTSMLRKLFLIFNSQKQKSAIVETISLQIMGQIGATLYDIKWKTRTNESNNIIKLSNYPDFIKQFLESFDRSLEYVHNTQQCNPAEKYLRCLEIESILKLRTNMKESDPNFEYISEYLGKLILDISLSSDKSTETLTLEDIQLDYYSILHFSELMPLYDEFLKLVLAILNEKKIKLRSVAIKCLSMLANKNKSVLTNPMVKSTIIEILSDKSAASVRDATLDLISVGQSYIEFYKQINISYDDDSILVRKHVVKINELIYDKTSDLEIKIFVASHILLKNEDEEDIIIDSARLILLKRWLLKYDINNPFDETDFNSARVVLNVMSGVASRDRKTNEVFEWFLNFYALNEELHTEAVFKQITFNLKKLTDILVQDIIELQTFDSDAKTDVITKRQHYLNLLSMFADATISFISKDHISGLYPYMVSNEKSVFHYHILHIFNKTLQKLSNFKSNFLFDVEIALLTKLPKMNVNEIDEAIPLAWCIAEQRKDKTRITKACSSCLTHLHPYIIQANSSSKKITVDSKLQRLLYLVTAFARFCKFSPSNHSLAFVAPNEGLHEYIAKCLLVLSRNSIPHALRRISIKNLTKLCGNYSKLFNSKHILNLLDIEFQGKNLDIKLAILESLYDFFINEEQKSIRNSGVNGKFTSGRQNVKETIIKRDYSNEGICSALVSRYLNDILSMCLLSDFKSSLVAIRLLKLTLECGYVNPSQCIPTVIALLSSTERYVCHLAKIILSDIFEKYETMVYNSLSKGIALAMTYSASLQHDKYFKVTYLLKSLQDVIGSGKKNEPKFHRHIDKIINNYMSNSLDVNGDGEQTNCILFLCSNIINLQFSTQFEFYQILKTIDFTEEQLRDSILEILRHQEESQWDKNALRLAILTQSVVKGLKDFMLNDYGFKLDTFYFNMGDESELKRKQMPAAKGSNDLFVSIIENCLLSCKKSSIFIEYLDKQQYID